MKHKITYLDLFSGLGAFAVGLKQAGFEFENHYYSEIDKYAIANYKHNFKNASYVGEIEKIKEIKRPDIITFGSPCQNISLAGNRKGIQGKQSKLFFDAIKIIDKYRPSYFVFENVAAILHSNKGKDFEMVLRSIANLGVYECQWQLINTAWFLPQNRERLYLVGYIAKNSRSQIFPLKVPYQKGKENIRKIEIVGKFNDYNISGKVISPKRLYPTLMAHGSDSNACIEYQNRIRRLTPIEHERLQGLKDDWTKYGIQDNQKIILSDTQRCKLTGNAVSVPVVKEIGKAILGKQDFSLNGIDLQKSAKTIFSKLLTLKKKLNS